MENENTVKPAASDIAPRKKDPRSEFPSNHPQQLFAGPLSTWLSALAIPNTRCPHRDPVYPSVTYRVPGTNTVLGTGTSVIPPIAQLNPEIRQPRSFLGAVSPPLWLHWPHAHDPLPPSQGGLELSTAKFWRLTVFLQLPPPSSPSQLISPRALLVFCSVQIFT